MALFFVSCKQTGPTSLPWPGLRICQRTASHLGRETVARGKVHIVISQREPRGREATYYFSGLGIVFSSDFCQPKHIFHATRHSFNVDFGAQIGYLKAKDF